MTLADVQMTLQIVASATTVFAFLGIAVKPIRSRVSEWLGELFTANIKKEMVAQIGTLRADIHTDRELSNRRHRANTRELKKIAFGLQVSDERMKNHEVKGHTI